MINKSKLLLSERLEIEILIDKGYSYRAIAKVIGRSPNTVSYEIGVNGGKNRYNAQLANQYARTRKKDTRREWSKIEYNEELRNYIIAKLQSHWNPDEIAGNMRKDNLSFYASKTAIYEWLRSVYGQRYCQYLYTQRLIKKKRINTQDMVLCSLFLVLHF